MMFSDLKNLRDRTLSGVVLAVFGILVILAGGWFFTGMLILTGVIAFYELLNLSIRTDRPVFYVTVGLIYIFFCFYTFFLLRGSYPVSFSLLFIAMVASSDTGAYFSGKIIGGPKMWEVLSPKKTWAGLMGAMLSPALVGAGYAAYAYGFYPADFFTFFFFVSTGLFIGLIGQVGDLTVSFLKRRAGAKDAGCLIPGHGGVLDRIDAMMLCAPVFLFLMSKSVYVF